jgi:hypothetical protein
VRKESSIGAKVREELGNPSNSLGFPLPLQTLPSVDWMAKIPLVWQFELQTQHAGFAAFDPAAITTS